jgi:serine/threonine-protein phosphatase with EF-hand domain
LEKKNLLFLFDILVALAAVVIIQTWFRRRRALFEIRRKTAWTIYQNIEYAGEQDQLKVFY